MQLISLFMKGNDSFILHNQCYGCWWPGVHKVRVSSVMVVSGNIPVSSTEAFTCCDLTHWGRVTHICVGKLTINGSHNGLSPGRCQAIIWTNTGILLIGPLATNFSEILIGIQTFSFKKMHLKMSSAKWRPFVSTSASVVQLDDCRCAVFDNNHSPSTVTNTSEIPEFMHPTGRLLPWINYGQERSGPDGFFIIQAETHPVHWWSQLQWPSSDMAWVHRFGTQSTPLRLSYYFVMYVKLTCVLFSTLHNTCPNLRTKHDMSATRDETSKGWRLLNSQVVFISELSGHHSGIFRRLMSRSGQHAPFGALDI